MTRDGPCGARCEAERILGIQLHVYVHVCISSESEMVHLKEAELYIYLQHIFPLRVRWKRVTKRQI